MKNLEEFKIQELTKSEMLKVQGGLSIFRVEGWFDGEPGSRGYLFGFKIWDTY